MPPEEELLSARLERLEIAGSRSPMCVSGSENPFRAGCGRRRTKSRSGRPTRPTVTFKGKANVVALDRPVDSCDASCKHPKCCRPKGDIQLSSVHRDLHSLVTDCNRLKISDELRDAPKSSNSTPSCSQQALNPPCDVTIDELASYFETFVHIPKKMTTMAEMMYT